MVDNMNKLDDSELLAELSTVADRGGGHFTIMKFTTNWRVGFGTPSSRCDIDQMWEGATFAEAAHSALAGYRDGKGSIVSPRCETHEMLLRAGLTGACPYCGDVLPGR